MAATWDSSALLDSYGIEQIGAGASGTTHYRITERWRVGLTGNSTAKDALDAGPAIGDAHGTVITSELISSTASYASDQNVMVTLVYEPEPDSLLKNAYGEIWQWDLATAEQHITHVERAGTSGPQTQSHYPSSGAGHYLGRAIGVSDSDTVDGCDIYRPAVTLRITKEWKFGSEGTLPGGSISAWINKILANIAKIDDDLVVGSSTILIGATVSRTEKRRYRAEYVFAVAHDPLTEGIEVYDNATQTEVTQTVYVNGWDYKWLRSAKKIDIATDEIVTVIADAHVARPYDTTDTLKEDLGIMGSAL